jgi:hypothetical protein
MMDKDGLRRDSLREGLKTKGRSRREASARHAEAEISGFGSDEIDQIIIGEDKDGCETGDGNARCCAVSTA